MQSQVEPDVVQFGGLEDHCVSKHSRGRGAPRLNTPNRSSGTVSRSGGHCQLRGTLCLPHALRVASFWAACHFRWLRCRVFLPRRRSSLPRTVGQTPSPTPRPVPQHRSSRRSLRLPCSTPAPLRKNQPECAARTSNRSRRSTRTQLQNRGYGHRKPPTAINIAVRVPHAGLNRQGEGGRRNIFLPATTATSGPTC